MLTAKRIAQGLSPNWTAEDRLLVIAALLPDMQSDIYAGTYSVPGHPNITSLQHVISEPSEVLEEYREYFAPAVAKLQALWKES